MNREKQKNYTAEFKASAVKMATESTQSVLKAAESLGVNPNTLHTSIYQYNRPKTVAKVERVDEHIYDELKRLKGSDLNPYLYPKAPKDLINQ